MISIFYQCNSAIRHSSNFSFYGLQLVQLVQIAILTALSALTGILPRVIQWCFLGGIQNEQKFYIICPLKSSRFTFFLSKNKF